MSVALTAERALIEVMPKANALLSQIESSVWGEVQNRLTPVQLERGQVLQRPGEDLASVYFPTSAVLALGLETVAGESVNVTLLGREGGLGVFEACGSRQSYTRATAWVAGTVWRLPASAYRELFSNSSVLRREIHKYVEVLLAESRQNVACNALHTVENRLARALLDVCDRSGANRLPITQDAISQLLGVQRTTIAASVSALQKQGLVRSGRGAIEIVDLEGLKAATCSCRETLAYVREDIQSRTEDVCEA